MFKKVPYGVKVRVRGNERDRFVAEIDFDAHRFLPFLGTWITIKNEHPATGQLETFPTFELAQEAAMRHYHRWVAYIIARKKTRLVKKVSRKTVWEHP